MLTPMLPELLLRLFCSAKRFSAASKTMLPFCAIRPTFLPASMSLPRTRRSPSVAVMCTLPSARTVEPAALSTW
nr:hypothetical protein [Acidovorax sp. SUPP3334]